MNRLLHKSLPLALIPVLLSCLRTDEYILEETTPPPATAAGSRLTAVYARDSSLPAGMDTVYIQRFTYDALGRILAATGTDKQLNGDSLHLDFFYQGSDTLATRIVYYDRYTGPINGETFDTIYLRYQNGRLASDSSVKSNGPGNPSFAQWTTYIYNGSSVFHYQRNSFDLPLTAADTAIEGYVNSMVNVNGNRTAESSDSAVYNPQTGSIRVTAPYSTFTSTYDIHPNPVFRAARAYQNPRMPIEYFVELLTDGSITRNLPLETRHACPAYPGGVAQTSNTYVFRPDGLPSLRRMRFFEQGTWTNWETVYYRYD